MPPKKKAQISSSGDTLAALMADVNAIYPGAMTLGSHPDLSVVRRSTDVLPLDHLLDGGLPRGRFIEVFGPYSTLKSYYAYKALGEAQKRGEKVALIDFEHSFDPVWGEECGMDVKTIPVARPETAEQGIGILNALILQKYDLVVWDSIAAAQPAQYREAAPGDDEAPAALARVMSRGLARLTASNKHTTVIFINQTRATIGVTFGPKSTTSGGKAMGFYASLRMSFVRIGKITEVVQKWDGEKYVEARRVIGHKIQCTLEKSKVSAPYTDCMFVFDLRTGRVDDAGWLIGQGLERGLIQRTKTGHHTIPGVLDKAIHGAEKFRTWFLENEEVQEWLTEEILPSDDSGSDTA